MQTRSNNFTCTSLYRFVQIQIWCVVVVIQAASTCCADSDIVRLVNTNALACNRICTLAIAFCGDGQENMSICSCSWLQRGYSSRAQV